MLEQLKKFEEKSPEIVFEWFDEPTGARGWTVINSLRGGAAGGGTRMRVGLDKHEVTSLAKTMEIKFAVAGPDIGGAKSGINFDPNDPRKLEVLQRWYAAVKPILKSYYGTGGDLNIDEIKEVIPITKALGIEHPQEGVFVGHFKPTELEKSKAIHNLQVGVTKEIESEEYAPKGHFVVADMITGWGVTESVRHFYQIWKNESLIDKKVIIQGWGNVGAAAAWYFAKMGAKIVGIIDRVGGLIFEDGASFEQINTLFINKDGNKLVAENLLSFEEINEKIWSVKADIFIPAAASRLVTENQLEQLKSSVKVISCGANVPFSDTEIFYGKTSEYADNHFTVIPDFIANCGMARTFAYLMQPNISLEDDAIFQDVSNVIQDTLKNIYNKYSKENLLMEASYEYILNKLMPEAF
jgi:glutamate dehydrogenase/leucine dehydrogenase